MTIGRTHDARVFIDSNPGNTGDFGDLTNVLGLTIEGETTTTQEYFLGNIDAQAEIHAVGGGVSFSTVYDTAAFDTLSAITQTPNGSPALCAVVCPNPPASWQIIPVAWIRPSFDAPETDAITRPWALTRTGRGDFGTVIRPFSVPPGNAGKVIFSGFGPSNGTRAAIIITNTDDASAITIAGRTGVPTYGTSALRRASIRTFDVASGAAANLTMTTTGGTVAGFVVQGSREALPNG